MDLKETFAGASGVDITSRDADTGQAWAGYVAGGAYNPVVTTGTGRCRPASSGVVAAVRSAYTPPSADYSVRFEVDVASFMGVVAFLLRCSASAEFNSSSFYQVQANGTSGSGITWEAAKITNGSNVAISPGVPGSYSVGDVLDCELAISGSSTTTITLSVNGSPIATWTDSSSPFTSAGLLGFYFFHTATPSDTAGVQVALYESPPEPAVTPGGTFVLQPASVTVGSTSVVTAVGTGTSWTGGTTFSVSDGGTGASATVVSVDVAHQTASITIVAGSANGPLTISDSTDDGTATLNVVSGSGARRKWFPGLDRH